MKRIILLISVFSIIVFNAFTQKWEKYFSLGVGTGYLMNANISDSPQFLFEYGKTTNWLDFSAAIEYCNSETYNNNFLSLVFKTKFDLIGAITVNSPHSFKIGAGVGVGTLNFSPWIDILNSDTNTKKSGNYFLSSILASYEYRIFKKTSLGVFYNNYTEDVFFGLHYLGFNLRRYF
jgi:hypothetical protein